MEDGALLLSAVEAVRAALPPELPAAELVGGFVGGASGPGRERALGALRSLATAIEAEAAPLHPMQLEVLYRQITHALAVVCGWGASSTSEETLHATLCALRALLRQELNGPRTAAHWLCAPPMREALGLSLASLLDLTGAAMRLSSARRVACICAVRSICELPGMDANVLGFFLPGVASRLAALASADEKLYARTAQREPGTGRQRTERVLASIRVCAGPLPSCSRFYAPLARCCSHA